MAEAFGADQRWQVLGFYDFCKSNNLIDEVQNNQWNAPSTRSRLCSLCRRRPTRP